MASFARQTTEHLLTLTTTLCILMPELIKGINAAAEKKDTEQRADNASTILTKEKFTCDFKL